MTIECSGRHRVPSRYLSSVLAATSSPGTAGTAAKTGAVLAVSGGLVASLGLQAHAATTPVAIAPKSVDAGSQVSAGGSIQLASAVTAAPVYGTLGFTAKAAPKRVVVDQPDTVADSPSSDTSSSNASDSSASSSSDADTSIPEPVSIKAGAPGSAEFGAAVMAIAAKYEGIYYIYGGTTPRGFDCSGYTGYVMRQVGISLPRTSSSQRAATTRISRSDAVPGDLVFMPGHVGIYAGNGMMWDSPRTGGAIGKRAIYSSSATYGRVS